MALTYRSDLTVDLTPTQVDDNFRELATGVNPMIVGTTGNGIKVDSLNTPVFGWRDITAGFVERGASAPTLTNYNSTGYYAYQFPQTGSKELYVEFHIPHDYVPGSDIFIHTHWSQTTVDTGGAAGSPGDVKWYFDALYAKGHGQQAFPNTVTTVSVVQTASSTVRMHMIAEVQLSTAGAIGGNALEVDGVVLVRMYRNSNDAADTLNVAPFAHFCDIHYQSTNMATLGKAPAFYAT
jgi:hypothetical protein